MKATVADWMSVVALGLLAAALPASALADEPASPREAPAAGAAELRLETLMHEALEGFEGVEVIVSRVTVPPNTALPRHWHPGEEFAYVLEGSASLWLEGEELPLSGPGDVVKIPLKKVHTAISGDEGATFLVFRVHEKGQPERTLVE